MNGHGTAPEPPEAPPEAPAPPPWMHDYVPQSVIFDCQGPDCDAAARAYWQPPGGFVAPGWQALDQRPFCSWICVARYAALKAEGDLASLQALTEEPEPTRRRSRHN